MIKNDTEYMFGYVAFIDILGFSNYCSSDKNFNAILSLMEEWNYFKRNLERNLDADICLMSDSVIIFVEIDNAMKFDEAFFQSSISLVSLFKNSINRKTGLFSRASITIGKYYYDKKKNIVFGPAIARAAKLAESPNELFKKIKSPKERPKRFIKNRPAMFIVDRYFLKYPEKEIEDMILCNMLTFSMREDERFLDIGGDFFIVNTYFYDYDFMSSIHDLNIDDYCDKARKTLDAKAIGKYKKKYCCERLCLEKFEKSKRNAS